MANREEKIQREADETARSVRKAVLAGKEPPIPSATPGFFSTKTHEEQEKIHSTSLDAEREARELKKLRDEQAS